MDLQIFGDYVVFSLNAGLSLHEAILRLGVSPPCVTGSHDTSLFNNLPACELSVC